jgi:hypothetical protein
MSSRTDKDNAQGVPAAAFIVMVIIICSNV